jgi:AcrR family transcriptional regulator
MTPRPDVSQERMSQIIEAAMTVFAEKGFNQARMDDIAKESGVSKGLIYWYFKSKDEIITAILDTMISRDLASVGALDDLPTAREKLLAFTQASVDGLLKMKPLMPILFEFWGLMMRRKTGRQTLHKYYRAYLDALIPIIREGIDRGEFRPVDAESVAVAMGAIFEGTIVLWAYVPETASLEEHILSGVRLLLDGLEAVPGE